jgi:hypothetical protein
LPVPFTRTDGLPDGKKLRPSVNESTGRFVDLAMGCYGQTSALGVRGSKAAEPGAGRWVDLRPVGGDDLEFLRVLASTPGSGPRYRYRGVTPSPERFRTDLWNDVLCQYLLVGHRSERRLGLVSAFAPSTRDGHAHLGVLLADDVRRRGWALEGVGLFIEHLFNAFQLRKLYVQVSTLWPSAFHRAIPDLLVEEARLIDHDFFAGRYGDSVIYALWRDRWSSPTNRHRALLLRRSPTLPMPPAAAV